MPELTDPFAGWTQADVGCYWSRQLPDGRTAHLASTSAGYTLTVDFQSTHHPDLDDAITAFAALADTAGVARTTSS